MSTEGVNSKCDLNDPVQHRKTICQDLTHIMQQARIARINAEKFIEHEFVSSFKRSYDEMVESYKTNEPFDWLPKLPTKLGEPVPQDHLKGLKYPEDLLRIYTDLQKVAVGVEKSIEDEEAKDGPLLTGFNDTRQHIKSVLTELQIAIEGNNLPIPSDLTKDIMGNVQNTSNTFISLRNWIIYREYLNLLDYIIQVFEYFEQTVV